MRKKIMHISQSNGGVAKYLKMLFKYLDKDKYEQILVYPSEYISEKEEFEVLVDKIEFADMVREISIKDDIKSIIQIYKLIKKYNPDLIYLHSSKAGALGRIINIIARKPIIYNSHGWAFNMDISKIKKYIYRLIEKFLARYCNKIIAISEQEKISAIDNKICKEDKIEVIYNGIDIGEYEASKLDKIEARGNKDIPNDSLVIGMVGRICKQKSVDTFVKVAARIKSTIPNSYFVIVGDGDEREKIESLIEELGLKDSVLITGWVKNTYEYIQTFDIAMLLSRWEGFGLAIAEYMVSEVPIIATNVDAIPNLIKNNEDGILVEVDNIDEVFKSTIKIVEDKEFANKIINNSKNKVLNNFDIRRVVYQHQKLFEELI
mgnify:FL=1